MAAKGGDIMAAEEKELKETIRVMMSPELEKAIVERLKTAPKFEMQKMGEANIASAGLVGGICCNGAV